ncbi:MAG: NAD(P)-binding protein [Pseudomonadota bacterium]
MRRIRIVGGGLTGILAALQAHRMGARDIELYERLDELGGVALPQLRDGREMREGCIYFGPKGDPIRSLLEEHGAAFSDFDNRFGSVSAGSDGLIYTDDFGGPALDGTSTLLAPLEGESLLHRLQCYEDDLTFPLARYVRWHVGCAPAQLHASAAVPLAINRVFPTGITLSELSKAKQNNPLANELFGIPRKLWDYSSNVQASLPLDGFHGLFGHCRKVLKEIGVRVYDRKLATPRAMLSEETADDIVIWAASPMPLFKAVGVETPKAPAQKFATYTFEVDWTGPVPFYAQNFTATGSCFRTYIYESGGSVLLTAECVVETDTPELIKEIHQILEGFEGEISVGDQIFSTVKPRWLYHSVDTIDRLGKLRGALNDQRGNRFIPGAWEAYAKGEKFAEVEADLQRALDVSVMAKAS